MRVTMIETGGWGGIAHYTWNLCQALANEGAEISLLTNTQYELASLSSAFRVEPCFDEADGYLRAVGALLRWFSALSPDIVHVQSLLSTRLDAMLWPLVRRWQPMVMTAHNIRSHENTPWGNWTLWRCLRVADAVIVHTQESAGMAAARLPQSARIRVVHHGDYGFFASAGVLEQQEARRLLDLPVNARILLAFGAIRPYKGILELIAALPRIRTQHPDAYLVIVGPLLVGVQGEYQEAIGKAGVEDAVAFRPQYVPHGLVAPYFAAADVAVYNYRNVTDSGSLRIACSLGKPVVATAVGGFREFLTDGLTGRLVPPGDVQSLASSVCDMLDDPAGAARMAAAAQALAASRWSWADSATATLALYGELVGAKPPALAAAGQTRDDSMRSTPDRKPRGTHAG